MASIDMNGEENSSSKGFDSPDDALKWIEKKDKISLYNKLLE